MPAATGPGAASAAVEVGGKTLFVYTTPTPDGRHFGLRARIAALAALESAPDLVIYDNGGASLGGLQLVARGSRAYVLFDQGGATRGLVVDASGVATPIRRVDG